MAKYNIGGYIFNDENSAKKAAKELKTVEYVLGQMKDADEEGVLKVYKKLLKQRLFSTEVGMGFLNQLRQNLLATGDFTEDDIPPVYIIEESVSEPTTQTKPKERPASDPVLPPKSEPKATTETEAPAKEKKVKEKKVKERREKKPISESDIGIVKRLRLINRLLTVCVIALLLCVIGMFYISSTINSPTILNYKEAITDEYASWKQQLDDREKALDEREARLNEREANVSDIEGN
ncbi:hypothetical protein [Pseudobutyrivibrio xylanivorans]|uniref:Uncharacterized protein n=1 Tax=Pseudobutyrivibrio xylanivorans TaxID=185007 RepID=A0A5P6VV42_PSEXY|nr:hypothetical protein [Pseudobutyrivibrio xylanivorans]QFJ55709.1 hypothetical protein FXF36_12880 [Pseudobutyrivibrio xylanivorans]